MTDNQNMYEDEIDLREYIDVICKNKKVVIGVFLMIVLSAFVFSFLAPKVYEVSATVQLGQAGGLLISKPEATQMMLSRSNLSGVSQELGLRESPESMRSSIKIEDVKDTDLLRIKITSSQPGKALKVAGVLASFLAAQGQQKYQQAFSLLTDQLSEVDLDIKDLSESLTKVKDLSATLASPNELSRDDAILRMLLLQNVLSSTKENLLEFKKQQNELKQALSRAKEFVVVDQPSVSADPISPNKKKIVILSIFLGVIASIISAFFVEFWQRNFKESSLK